MNLISDTSVRAIPPVWAATALLSLTCAPDARAAEPAPPRPNVILAMADDMGWGDPSFNGGWINTPNLDAMAHNGLQFNRFYSAAPVCSPTRGSCLTGRNPIRLGIPQANEGRLRLSETTVAEVLSAAGYTTAHFGKWHVGVLTTLRKDSNRGGSAGVYSPPWQHGFDTCFSTEAKVPTYHPMRKPKNGSALPTGFGHKNFYGARYWTPPADPATWFNSTGEGTAVPVTENLSGDDSRVMMDRAIPFIRDAVAQAKPFFTIIWFHTPHKPVVDPDESAGVNSQNAYRDAVQDIDEQMGRLRAELAALGVQDNTMLWFCSDNGPENNVPGKTGGFRGRKRSLHEGGVRVPGLLEWPARIPQARTSDYPVVTSDYYPTILDALELSADVQKPLDGMSVLPVIEGAAEEPRPMPIGFLFKGDRSWVTHQYKLISKDGGSSYQLYDLLADPREQTNLANAMPDKVAELKEELLAWMDAVHNDTEYVSPHEPPDPPPEGEVVVISDAASGTVDSQQDIPGDDDNNTTKFSTGGGGEFTTELYVRGSSSSNASQRDNRRVRALLHFDVSAVAGRTVYQALLKFRGYSLNNNNDVDLLVSRLAEAWDAAAMPYAPTIADTVNAGSVITPGAPGQGADFVVDITPIVQQWSDGSAPNHGLFLELAHASVNNGLGLQLAGSGAAVLEALCEEGEPAPLSVAFMSLTSEGGEATSPAVVDLALNRAPTSDVAVAVQVSGGTAVEGEDFVVPDTVVAFEEGSTTAQFVLSIVDDLLIEDDEAVTLSLLDSPHLELGATVSHTHTILDNDGDVDVTLPFVATVDAEGDIPGDDSNNSAKFSTGGGGEFTTALYVRGNASSNNSRRRNRRVRVFVAFDLSSLAGAPIDRAQLAFRGYSLNDQNDVNLRVSRLAEDWPSSATPYAPAIGDTIDAGSVMTPGAPGQGADFVVDVTPIVAQWLEGGAANHGFFLELAQQNVNNGLGIGTAGAGAITLQVQRPGLTEPQPLTVRFAATQSRADESASPAVVNVELNQPSPGGVRVDVRVVGGTADAGTDFLPPSSRLEFGAGLLMAPLALTVLDDFTMEDDERVDFVLENPVGALLGATREHSLTIANDDGNFEAGTVIASDNWTHVPLANVYLYDPVVVCVLARAANPAPAVVRVRNVTPDGFQVRLQNPSETAAVGSLPVHFIAMEEGAWRLPDGTRIEAARIDSGETNHRDDWGTDRMVAYAYQHTYDARPVVLGQVVTENDPLWSAFWSRGGDAKSPPSATECFVGKHVAEDPFIERNAETLGVIVVEASAAGDLGHGVPFASGWSGNNVRGVANNPPYATGFAAGLFAEAPQVGVACMGGMNGGNGGWAYLHGSNPLTAERIQLAIDEDQVADGERNHTAETVAYVVIGRPTYVAMDLAD